MKKLFLIASLVLASAGIGFAQTTPAAPAKTKTEKTAKPAAGPTKKDGTPDMRYKANKDAAKTPAQHTKKDGTPDMRYKENKDKAKKS
ncbi:MAG: hypothetical protein JST42_28630 [Bacteroidetes bacterium]|nr:hypothetical protein [Bacteroidota bacterium]